MHTHVTRSARFDASGTQPHHPVAALRQCGIVRDEHQRGVAFLVAGEQQLDDLAAGRLVEIAGRFVGDENRRMRRHGARERDALLLAAGQFCRIMVHALGKADRGKLGGGALEGIRGAREFERHRDVLQRRHGGDEMKTLENDSDIFSAKAGERILVELPRSCPATCTVPVSGRSSPAATISRVDLPEPDGPTRPTASPLPICRPISLRICTRAAPRPSDRLTPESRIAGAENEVSFMRFCLRPLRPARAVIWEAGAAGPALRRAVTALAFAAMLVAAGRHAADRPMRIVVLGDSLSAGFGLAANEALPAKLETALKAKGIAVAVENAGVSGDTAAGGLSRLDWSVPDGTDAVILELGANDALRGIDPKATRASLDAIIRRLKERRIAVLLAGMLAPRNLGPDYAKAFDAIYPELAAAHGLILYPFILEGVAGERTLNLSDGIHPTAAGVDVMVKGMLPKVEELIARVRAAKGS